MIGRRAWAFLTWFAWSRAVAVTGWASSALILVVTAVLPQQVWFSLPVAAFAVAIWTVGLVNVERRRPTP